MNLRQLEAYEREYLTSNGWHRRRVNRGEEWVVPKELGMTGTVDRQHVAVMLQKAYNRREAAREGNPVLLRGPEGPTSDSGVRSSTERAPIEGTPMVFPAAGPNVNRAEYLTTPTHIVADLNGLTFGGHDDPRSREAFWTGWNHRAVRREETCPEGRDVVPEWSQTHRIDWERGWMAADAVFSLLTAESSE